VGAVPWALPCQSAEVNCKCNPCSLQGIQMVAVPMDAPVKVVRLWAHETARVFHDRLVSDEDRSW